jgi:type IV secretory pathway VirB2 component (pilin)
MASTPTSFARVRWAALLLVSLFSLYLNLTAVANTRIDGLIRGDSKEYLAYTFNLLFHGVYSIAGPMETPPQPDAIRPPGYVLFIAPLLDLNQVDFGVNSVLYAQAFIGALTTLISMLLFVRMMPFWSAILCGIVVAISPHLINATVYMLTETLFAFVLASHVYTLVLAKEKDSLPFYAASGLLLAVSWLIRPTTMLLAFVYILIFGSSILKSKLNWRAVACLVLPFFLVFSGWSIRNEISTGRMSDPLLTRQFIYHGSYINLMYQDRPETYGYPYRYDEVELNTTADAIEITIEHFKADPARFIYWMFIGKPITFLSWDLTESVGDAFIYTPLESPYFDKGVFILSHDVAKAMHVPLMALAVAAGLYFFFAKASFAAQVSSIIVLYFIGFHMLGAPFPRYSLPIRPFCYGMAACMLFEIYSILTMKNHSIRHSCRRLS